MKMGRAYLSPMRSRIALALLLFATPAVAERLEFDHRLSPPLQAVLDGGDTTMIESDSRSPTRHVDLIAVRGRSAQSWTEALEILSIARPRDIKDVEGWLALLQSQAQSRCAATFEVISRDANSVTFQRTSPHCPAESATFGLYRLVTGKRSWFQLSVLVRDDLSETARQQWLALFASAHLK